VRQLLFVGRLVERKGIRYLVEALGLLSRELSVHLSIVGTGPEEPALRKQVQALSLGGQVTFHGFVSQNELSARYRSCDVFVLPAVIDSKGDTEGLGVVIIDVMSYRKPVVASGVGGIVDLVIDGRTGLTVPPAQPEALAAALRRVLTDPALAHRLGDAGYDHIQQNYSWPAIIGRLETIYAGLVGSAS
jgi:glycosyltransferase involved in cell wall biosynthesis